MEKRGERDLEENRIDLHSLLPIVECSVLQSRTEPLASFARANEVSRGHGASRFQPSRQAELTPYHFRPTHSWQRNTLTGRL